MRSTLIFDIIKKKEERKEYVMDMSKKMYKDKKNEMIGGVCAGIADYFKIDPTLVRLAAVLLALLWGAGILVYIVAWIIMPDKSEVIKETLEKTEDDEE